MAAEHGIRIQRVSLRPVPGARTGSVYQSASDYCQLQVGRQADERSLDRYVSFLIAGSVAEMLAVEHRHEFTNRIATQNRFRNRWYQVTWSQPEVHLDFAYYYLAVWGPELVHFELERHQQFHWKHTLYAVEKPDFWQRIERVAPRLIAGEVLDQSAVLAAIHGK